jgi:hypothetical protein
LTVKVLLLEDVKKLEIGAVIAGFCEDIRPLKGVAGELDWLLCGSLSGLIIDRKLRGSLGEVALLTSRGKIPAPKIFLLGLGRSADLSPRALREAARGGVASAVGAGVTAAALDFFPAPILPNEELMAALREGLGEGAAGGNLEATLIAPDAASYERLNKLVWT